MGHQCSRRDLIKGALGCGAYVAFSLSALGSNNVAFAAEKDDDTVIKKPFARVEKLSERVWAVVATPAGGAEVVSNSGIIHGKDGVLVIDACISPAGSQFIAEAAKQLTGSYPTHVVVTHYHYDHTNGLIGYLLKNPNVKLISSKKTRNLICDWYKNEGSFEGEEQGSLLYGGRHFVVPSHIIADEDNTSIDLGGVKVNLISRFGHTPSDITVEIDSPRIVWCGDLVFNGLFPYYGDAIPTELSKSCHALLSDSSAIYVPGHGSVSNNKLLKPYLELIDHVGEAAQKAIKKGVPADEAWKEYQVPASLGEWAKFRPDVYRFAFEAWEREIKK